MRKAVATHEHLMSNDVIANWKETREGNAVRKGKKKIKIQLGIKLKNLFYFDVVTCEIAACLFARA
jgi:hypothetical protein